MATFQKLTIGKYWGLHKKGALCTIPYICVLLIKRDESLPPLRAKSGIVIFGNQEECDWSKPKGFTSVLCSDLLRLLTSLAVKQRRTHHLLM